MTLDTVIGNMERTIAGKKEFLSALNPCTDYGVCKYLKINIEELERILSDLKTLKGN